MKSKKENRGGKRAGSGRKKGPKTKTVSFRVRKEFVDPIKKTVEQKIQELLDNVD